MKDSACQLKQTNSELNECQSVIEKLTSEHENLRKANVALQSEIDAKSLELTDTSRSVEILQETNLKNESELTDMEKKIQELTATNISLQDHKNVSEDVKESNGDKIIELQKKLIEKEAEIAALKAQVRQLEDEDKSTFDTTEQKAQDIQELQDILDIKETKIQELVKEIEDLRFEYDQVKAQKERITTETELEINACMSTIANQEERINNLDDDFKLEQERHQTELEEIKSQFKATQDENEELTNQIQSSKRNATISQQNYEQLLANSEVNESTKELISERDKAVKKNNLLTDKCKKLITKCKQQELQLKEKETELSKQIDKLKTELETLQDEVDVKASKLNELETERQQQKANMIKLVLQIPVAI